MAELEQLFRLNADFMQRLMEQQAKVLQDVIEKVGKGTGDKKPMTLDERRFREIGSFDGTEEKWKEWSSKFKGAVKEVSLQMFEGLKHAEGSAEELDPDDLDDQGTEIITAVYNRLMMLVTGSAFTIHLSVMHENGLEVWRRLTKRYNPKTPMRGLQLMRKSWSPGRSIRATTCRRSSTSGKVG
jgi:hypothetical protein